MPKLPGVTVYIIVGLDVSKFMQHCSIVPAPNLDAFMKLSESYFLIFISSPTIVPLSIHPPLNPQARITACLKYAAHFKCPRHFSLRAHEEEAHFHGVSDQPVGKHRCTEALARLSALVGEDLGKGQCGLYAETKIADEEGVKGGWSVRCE